MNSNPHTIPGIKSLYHLDPAFHRAVSTCVFFFIAAVGIKWATQPVPSVVKVEKSPFDIWLAELGPIVALVVSVLALLVLVRRYLWVRKVLSRGTTIKGTLADVDIYEREAARSDTSTPFNVAKIRSYYATIRYNWRGLENEVRFKLPLSPSTYQISKDKEIDLIILDSAPKKPLIRAMYLGAMLPSRGWKRFL
jgi:hypothetical protein